jgi:hypothetical protein
VQNPPEQAKRQSAPDSHTWEQKPPEQLKSQLAPALQVCRQVAPLQFQLQFPAHCCSQSPPAQLPVQVAPEEHWWVQPPLGQRSSHWPPAAQQSPDEVAQ